MIRVCLGRFCFLGAALYSLAGAAEQPFLGIPTGPNPATFFDVFKSPPASLGQPLPMGNSTFADTQVATPPLSPAPYPPSSTFATDSNSWRTPGAGNRNMDAPDYVSHGPDGLDYVHHDNSGVEGDLTPDTGSSNLTGGTGGYGPATTQNAAGTSQQGTMYKRNRDACSACTANCAQVCGQATGNELQMLGFLAAGAVAGAGLTAVLEQRAASSPSPGISAVSAPVPQNQQPLPGQLSSPAIDPSQLARLSDAPAPLASPIEQRVNYLGVPGALPDPSYLPPGILRSAPAAANSPSSGLVIKY